MSRTEPTANPPEPDVPLAVPSGTGPSGTAGEQVAGERVTERIVIPAPAGGSSPQSRLATQPGQAGLSSDAMSRSGSQVLGDLPFDPASEPEDWPSRGPAKGVRINWLTALLVVLLIGGGGIWGGAALQRSHGSSTGSLASSIASRFASLRSGSSGSGGTSHFAGLGSSAATTGTVTEVQGSTLYVTNSSGNLVEVKLTPSTTVTRDAKTTLSALAPGDTVVVEGTKAKNGTVSASSVSATAQGVTPGGGSFGF